MAHTDRMSSWDHAHFGPARAGVDHSDTTNASLWKQHGGTHVGASVQPGDSLGSSPKARTEPHPPQSCKLQSLNSVREGAPASSELPSLAAYPHHLYLPRHSWAGVGGFGVPDSQAITTIDGTS
jgi:hypothetical protein